MLVLLPLPESGMVKDLVIEIGSQSILSLLNALFIVTGFSEM